MTAWTKICRVEDIPVLGSRRVARDQGLDVAVFRNDADEVFALLDRAEDPGLMTDIVCQQFIHEADLRQKLLEMDLVGDRIPVICEYLRKASAAATED